ncbi:fluoride efflux transporter CrcB [Micromonospora zingiberis]|uniref:Fluoride-specific ion channel FluC n=1 Tax=Micromonospora zingiberis TaxID=2053011 RepID=A0A4V2LXA4_9ACTN|nr:fluoride efflux transporter CrcB [Micromonospora zingiberis]TCB99615.1 fluoride efflux transporter CrcB [Micromonospora zingiberis]
MTVLLVALGAAVGAPLRYLLDRAVQSRHDSAFPWGTLTVNVVGSLILGVLIGGATVGAVPGSLVALLGSGLCGALTTYSTFGYETVRLFEDGARRHALANVVLSVAAALGAAFVAVTLTAPLWP